MLFIMTDSNSKIKVEISRDLEDLIPEYLESMDTSLAYLEQLVVAEDFPEIKSEAHKMKGHGGAYGFRYISDMGLLIEGFAREQKELISKCLNELKNYLGGFRLNSEKTHKIFILFLQIAIVSCAISVSLSQLFLFLTLVLYLLLKGFNSFLAHKHFLVSSGNFIFTLSFLMHTPKK